MSNFDRTIIKAVLIPFLLWILFAHNANATGTYPSFGITLITSGNGLAMSPALTARYSFRKFDAEMGATYQFKESRITGAQTNIYWYAQPATRKVRLAFILGVRYYGSASLKNVVVAQEEWKQPESNVNFDELRVQCLEFQVGFGLRVHHSLRWNSFYGIGAGAYTTLGDSSPYTGMHRPLSNAELTLNFGVSYSIR